MKTPKKREQRKGVKKDRTHRIDAYFKIPRDESAKYTLTISRDGDFELNANGQKIPPSQINSQFYYDRESKRKIITSSESSYPPFTNASLILRNYNFLCVIDTNTRKINNRTISVSVIFLGQWINAEKYAEFEFWPELYMDFMDCTDKPERYAWHKFIQLIEKGTDYNGINTFGIIVDSDLGEIPSINQGVIPVYEQYYLPDQMELIYASADKSGTVQNAMIKKCDQFAAQRLNRFKDVYKSGTDLDKFPKSYQNITKFNKE